MLTLNLLPWRERQRRLRRRWGVVLGVGVMLLLALIWRYYPVAPTPPPATLSPIPALTTRAPKKISWRYIGYLQQQHRVWGIVQTARGNVREVEVDMPLPGIKARVAQITPQSMSIRCADGQEIKLPFMAPT